MSGKKLALFSAIVLVMIYLAGGAALVSDVLQYLLSVVTKIATDILNSVLGLLRILHIG